MVKIGFMLAAVIIMHLNIGCKMKKVLPKTTQEGLNTFGVKINGKVWLPVQKLSVLGSGPKLDSDYYEDIGLLGITAKNGTNDEVLQLTVLDVRSVGSYSFNIDSKRGSATEYNGKLVDDRYFPYAGGISKINITKLDTVNKIVAGTFEVQLKGKNNGIIKNLTQGIFDLKYDN